MLLSPPLRVNTIGKIRSETTRLKIKQAWKMYLVNLYKILLANSCHNNLGSLWVVTSDLSFASQFSQPQHNCSPIHTQAFFHAVLLQWYKTHWFHPILDFIKDFRN